MWAKGLREESPPQPELLLSLANTLARMQRLEQAAAIAERLSTIPGWEVAGLPSWGQTDSRSRTILLPRTRSAAGWKIDREAKGFAPLEHLRSIARSWQVPSDPGAAEEADRWLEPAGSKGPGGSAGSQGQLAGQPVCPQQHQSLDRARAEVAKEVRHRPNATDFLDRLLTLARRSVPLSREITRAHDQTGHGGPSIMRKT